MKYAEFQQWTNAMTDEEGDVFVYAMELLISADHAFADMHRASIKTVYEKLISDAAAFPSIKDFLTSKQEEA